MSQKVSQYISQIAVFFESVGVVLNIKNTYLVFRKPRGDENETSNGMPLEIELVIILI